MIKFCEDIQTMDEFKEFCLFHRKTIYMGLIETVTMISWNWHNACYIDPIRFDKILLKFKDD